MTKLPNFIVIGAPKSGTTSLFYYLKQHPDIYLPERKELHYFSCDRIRESTNGPGDKLVADNLCSSRESYESYYKGVGEESAIGEVSPSYLYHSDASERILDELGRIKIIAILRNPVEKAFSQYMHLRRDNLETLGFKEALKEETRRREAGFGDIWRYAESSLYTERLKKYVSVFGRENLHLILFDDFIDSAARVVEGVYSFLGVDPGFEVDTSQVFNRSGVSRSGWVTRFLNEPSLVKSMAKTLVPERIRIPLRLKIMDLNTGSKDELDEDTRRMLNDYFAEDVRALEETFGLKTRWLDE